MNNNECYIYAKIKLLHCQTLMLETVDQLCGWFQFRLLVIP